MGFFDAFLKPKPNHEDELKNLRDEIGKRIFPGGSQELLFKSNAVIQLSNGKLNQKEAAEICWKAKFKIFTAITEFDGRKHFGPNAQKLIQETVADSENKLTNLEGAAIVFYLFFGKVDPGLDTPLTLKNYFEGMFGSDSCGCDLDEIPGGLGEFGLDPTNPIPVRGVASNKIYLNEIRTANGQKIEYKRNVSLKVPNIVGNIDEYEISQSGQFLCKLYVSPYHQKISQRPPKGFILIQKDQE